MKISNSSDDRNESFPNFLANKKFNYSDSPEHRT